MSKKKPEELCSISKLSEMFTLHRETVRKRLHAAKIEPVSERANEKLYRFSDVEAALEPEGNEEFEAARLRKITAEANLKEIELKRELGELVEIKVIQDDLHRMFQKLYQRLALQLPRDIALTVHRAKSPAQCEGIMRNAADNVFQELRREHEGYLKADGQG